MTIFLSQGCNEPPLFHHQSQWNSEIRNLMTARVLHLVGFLIDIFHKNKQQASFGNDVDRRYLLGTFNPPLPLSVANYWKKNSHSTTAEQYSYFLDIPHTSLITRAWILYNLLIIIPTCNFLYSYGIL